MKAWVAFLIILQTTVGFSGCQTALQLDPNTTYYDTGTVLRRIGNGNCQFLVRTDHYGIHETGMIRDYGICRAFYERKRVLVEITQDHFIKIIGEAVP